MRTRRSLSSTHSSAMSARPMTSTRQAMSERRRRTAPRSAGGSGTEVDMEPAVLHSCRAPLEPVAGRRAPLPAARAGALGARPLERARPVVDSRRPGEERGPALVGVVAGVLDVDAEPAAAGGVPQEHRPVLGDLLGHAPGVVRAGDPVAELRL